MITIRNGVFETNSSSEHSLTLCHDIHALPKVQFEQWKNGQVMFKSDINKVETFNNVAKNFWSYYSGAVDVKRLPDTQLSAELIKQLSNDFYFCCNDYANCIKHMSQHIIRENGITEKTLQYLSKFLTTFNYVTYNSMSSMFGGYSEFVFVTKQFNVNRGTKIVVFATIAGEVY